MEPVYIILGLLIVVALVILIVRLSKPAPPGSTGVQGPPGPPGPPAPVPVPTPGPPPPPGCPSGNSPAPFSFPSGDYWIYKSGVNPTYLNLSVTGPNVYFKPGNTATGASMCDTLNSLTDWTYNANDMSLCNGQNCLTVSPLSSNNLSCREVHVVNSTLLNVYPTRFILGSTVGGIPVIYSVDAKQYLVPSGSGLSYSSSPIASNLVIRTAQCP